MSSSKRGRRPRYPHLKIVYGEKCYYFSYDQATKDYVDGKSAAGNSPDSSLEGGGMGKCKNPKLCYLSYIECNSHSPQVQSPVGRTEHSQEYYDGIDTDPSAGGELEALF